METRVKPLMRVQACVCVCCCLCITVCVCASVYLCVCVWVIVCFWNCWKNLHLVFLIFFISPSSFLPAEGTGLRVYVFIVCPCVLIWFIMAISPRAAAGHLFLSPGALLVWFFFPPSQSQLIEIQAVFCRPWDRDGRRSICLNEINYSLRFGFKSSESKVLFNSSFKYLK